MKKWTVIQMARGGLIAAVTTLALLGGLIWHNVVRSVEASDWVEHTHEVLAALEDVTSSLYRANAAQRGYLVGGNEAYLKIRDNALTALNAAFDKVAQLTVDNPAQQARVSEIKPYLVRRTEIFHRAQSVRANEGLAAAVGQFGEGEPITEQIREIVEQAEAEEKRLLNERKVEERSATRVVLILMSVLGGGLIVALFFLSRRIRIDITSRERDEMAQREEAYAVLQRSETALMEAQRLAKVGSWEWILATDTLKWSPEIHRIFGRDAALPPPNIDELPNYFTSDSWAPLSAALETARTKGVPYECDAEVVRTDGTHGWIIARGEAVRNPNGTVIILHGTVQDITARKQAEKAIEEREALLRKNEILFRSLVSAMPDAIVLVDKSQHIVLANSAAHDLFGYSENEFRNLPLDALVPDMVRPKHSGLVEGYIAAPEPRAMGMGTLLYGRTKSGTLIPVEVALAPVQLDDDLLIIATARDISGRIKIEDTLRQSQKMEAVGQLTGGVAHDFNNLLTIIMGNLQLLDRSLADNPQARERVKTAHAAALRGADLTSRLLSFSRRQTLVPETIDLNEVIVHMDDLLRRTLGAPVVVETIPEDRVWPTRIDRYQLDNAIINLAANARDAMPKGGKLTIETANVHLDETYAAQNVDVQAGDYVMLAVTDTGTGMSAKAVRQAFEPFYTTKEAGKGTGLGLSMVYGFVKQSRGHAKIYSEEGHGTSVKLYFPRTQELAEEVSKTDINDVISAGTETILVVEDDSDVRAVAGGMLEELGYRILHAENGPAALAVLAEHPEVELLLTDVVMPGGMNGVEVAELARKRAPNIRVVYMSGYPHKAFLRNEPSNGGLAFISKPYKLEDLARTVRKILDS